LPFALFKLRTRVATANKTISHTYISTSVTKAAFFSPDKLFVAKKG